MRKMWALYRYQDGIGHSVMGACDNALFAHEQNGNICCEDGGRVYLFTRAELEAELHKAFEAGHLRGFEYAPDDKRAFGCAPSERERKWDAEDKSEDYAKERLR